MKYGEALGIDPRHSLHEDRSLPAPELYLSRPPCDPRTLGKGNHVGILAFHFLPAQIAELRVTQVLGMKEHGHGDKPGGDHLTLGTSYPALGIGSELPDANDIGYRLNQGQIVEGLIVVCLDRVARQKGIAARWSKWVI